jgi:hypothetical protein
MNCGDSSYNVELVHQADVVDKDVPQRGSRGVASTGGNQTTRMRTAIELAIGLLVCSVSLACMLPPASAATASKPPTRVTFGVEPASARGADGRPYFSFGVTPGAIVFDHAAVLNYSSIPLSLQLYATDAIETSQGGFGLLPASARPTGAGSWISLPPRFATVRVPAESAKSPGQVVVPFVVRVPDHAAPGDHAGGVVVSLRTVGTNASGQQVILLQRVGSRVFIQVAGALAPKLAVTDLHASYEGTLDPVGKGRAKVSYLLRNTGNVDLAVDQSVAVSGWLGGKRQVAVAKVLFLLPGASLPERVDIPGVWPQFLLHATVSARPMAAAGITETARMLPLTTSTSLWAIPWPLLALIALVVLAGYLAHRARSRARARRLARPLASRPQVVTA